MERDETAVRDAPTRVDGATQNQILRLLPSEELAWLRPHMERVHATIGDVLANPNEPFSHVYFPETCILSMVNPTDVGMVEVGTIGNEGMAGLSVFLDADSLPSRTVVQGEGELIRVPASVFAAGAQDRPALQHVLRRYTHAYLVQISQTAACNRMHDVEPRCARWLLMTHDRVDRAASFILTHEFLAFMLGTRRAEVTEVLDALRGRGVIDHGRGRITVLDRPGLEGASCECYHIVRGYFERALGN